MVQTINCKYEDLRASYAHLGGCPQVKVHHIERWVHGNGIDIKVYGQLKIAAKEIVYAREMKLNTIEILSLTAETGAHALFHPQKWIYSKGTYDNYASIDIYSPDAYQMQASGRSLRVAASALPEDGSIWLNFIAEGE